MALQFWLIVLAAVVLPEESRGSVGVYFRPDIAWYRLSYFGVLLRWNIDQLRYNRVEEVVLTVKLTFGEGETMENNASVEHGSIAVYGLQPNTYYTLDVTGYGRGVVIFGAQRITLTWPTAIASPSPHTSSRVDETAGVESVGTDKGSSRRILTTQVFVRLQLKFGLTNNAFSPTAPRGVYPPTGRAVSTKEIELNWSKPTVPNGILQPYIVNCFDNTFHSPPRRMETVDNATTSITVNRLRAGAEYQCNIVASTYPGDKQDPDSCETTSWLSDPIRTKALAPSRVKRPKGKAISATEIRLEWSKPKRINGVLKPYVVICVDTAQNYSPVSVTTEDSETTSAMIKGLHPNTKYHCCVIASTIPALEQNSTECETKSKFSDPIRTLASVVLRTTTVKTSRAGTTSGAGTTSRAVSTPAITGVIFTCIAALHAPTLA
eukprot:TsM_000955400 transcript=TsM_000955400 gene=TsM_000955400